VRQVAAENVEVRDEAGLHAGVLRDFVSQSSPLQTGH
jgi:hypothetical protein